MNISNDSLRAESHINNDARGWWGGGGGGGEGGCYHKSYQIRKFMQGRSESTSSVAFEILLINCQIEFIN